MRMERCDCWRVNGVHKLSPQQAAVLQELCNYRDEVARQRNRPLFKVISDNTLHAIASSLPSSLDELNNTARYDQTPDGPAWESAAGGGPARACRLSRSIHPVMSRPEKQFLARVEALKQWRKQKAHELEVESDIILPRDLLHLLAVKNPQEKDTSVGVPSRSPLAA